MNRIVKVELNAGSWYGHPEQDAVERLYQHAAAAARRRGDVCVEDDWRSPLVCWNLIGSDETVLARAYAPTEKTPRWVFTDQLGDHEIGRPISHERLMVLLVTYCLQGGRFVDALFV